LLCPPNPFHLNYEYYINKLPTLALACTRETIKTFVHDKYTMSE